MARRFRIPRGPDRKDWFQRIGVQTGLIFLLLLVLVPVLAVQVASRYSEFRGERQQELQTNLEIARAVTETFDAFVDDVLHQVEDFHDRLADHGVGRRVAVDLDHAFDQDHRPREHHWQEE